VKAFEEFPIRVDTERNTVDVVWREHRGGISPRSIEGNFYKNHVGPVRGNAVLRRERFGFNQVATPSCRHTPATTCTSQHTRSCPLFITHFLTTPIHILISIYLTCAHVTCHVSRVMPCVA
jgi:hypothetical protein